MKFAETLGRVRVDSDFELRTLDSKVYIIFTLPLKLSENVFIKCDKYIHSNQ